MLGPKMVPSLGHATTTWSTRKPIEGSPTTLRPAGKEHNQNLLRAMGREEKGCFEW